MKERQKGIAALILLAAVFASMGLFARFLATGFLLYQQVYLRMFAAMILSGLVFGKKIRWKLFSQLSYVQWGVVGLRAISYALFGIILFTQAIVLTKYSNVSFIGAIPMTAVLGFILLKEKFTWKKTFWIVLAFAGTCLISIKDWSHILIWGKGELLTLASTIFFAVSYIARKWQTKTLNNQELTFINFVAAFAVVFLVSLIKGDGLPTGGWNWSLLAAVIGAGWFNTMNVFLTNYGFQKVEAVLASNVLTLEGIFAVGLGLIFYHEVPLAIELLGGLIITISVIGMNKDEQS